jgi:peptidoglycan/xylan/chitin deacetylase (PgdA/CDA1 family)
VSWLGALRRGLDGPRYRVPILMYHRLAEPMGVDRRYDNLCVSPRAFDEQMRFLRRRGYKTLFASELILAIRDGHAVPERSVVVTFDDGYDNVLSAGMAPLERYDVKASVYLITEHHRLGKPGFLSPAQIHVLDRSGCVELGSHSRTHPKLDQTSDQQLEDEIFGSKAYLDELLGARAWTFCFPYGNYDRRVVRMVRRAGYLGALSTRPGAEHRPRDLYGLRRIRVVTEPIDSFARLLHG